MITIASFIWTVTIAYSHEYILLCSQLIRVTCTSTLSRIKQAHCIALRCIAQNGSSHHRNVYRLLESADCVIILVCSFSLLFIFINLSALYFFLLLLLLLPLVVWVFLFLVQIDSAKFSYSIFFEMQRRRK